MTLLDTFITLKSAESDRVQTVIDNGWSKVALTDGYLSEREARFLMAAMAVGPARGKNVEIGSFKGRSTVGLAHVARELGLGTVVAIDPHTSPAVTDPDLRGKTTSYDDFIANLKAAGVYENVEIERSYSHEVARRWKDPIRFLWVDGDHTYEGAKADIEMFKPFLADGAMVLMHDILGTFPGAIRVFVEEVLDCDDFGPAGFNGSIGWAQYRPFDGRKPRFLLRRRLMATFTRRLVRVAKRATHGLHGWNKFQYRFWRPLAPYMKMSHAKLARIVA